MILPTFTAEASLYATSQYNCHLAPQQWAEVGHFLASNCAQI